MKVIGGGHGDGVDLIAKGGEHFAEVGVLCGLGEGLAHFVEASLLDIAEADDVASAFGGVPGIAIAFSADADAGDLDLGVEVLSAKDGGESESGTCEEAGTFQEVASGIDTHGNLWKRHRRKMAFKN